MKNKTTNFIFSAVLTLIGILSSFLFFYSAFQFKHIEFETILIVVSGMTILSSYAWKIYDKTNAYAILLGVFLLLFFLLQMSTILNGAKAIINEILIEYMKYTPHIYPLFRVPYYGKYAQTALLFVFMFMGYALSYFIQHKKSIIFSILLPIPFLFSVVIYKLIPNFLSIIGIVFFYCYLLWNHKNQNFNKQILNIVQIIIVMSLVLFLFPYNQGEQPNFFPKIKEQVLSFTTKRLQEESSFTYDTVNLNTLGPRNYTETTVFRARLNNSTKNNIYLAQQRFSSYDGTSWKQLQTDDSDIKEYLSKIFFIGGNGTQSIDIINTNLGSNLLLTPLNPAYLSLHLADYTIIPETAIQSSQKEYSVDFYEEYQSRYISKEYKSFYNSTYLQIDADLKQYLLNRIPIDLNQSQQETNEDAIAERIRMYFIQNGTYTLSPPFYESDEFLHSFLENDAMKGYCVHFATAATMALRANGIPARYVEGYLAKFDNDQEFEDIKDSAAHAWTEYYTSEKGWQILDATPPASSNTETSTPDNSNSQEQQTTVPLPSTPEENETNQNQQTQPQPENFQFQLSMLLVPVFALIFIVAYYLIRKKVLKHRYEFNHSKTRNENALHLYRMCRILQKYGGNFANIKPLFELAKFSNHELSEEQYDQIVQTIEIEKKKLQSNLPLHKKIWLSYIKMYL